MVQKVIYSQKYKSLIHDVTYIWKFTGRLEIKQLKISQKRNMTLLRYIKNIYLPVATKNKI